MIIIIIECTKQAIHSATPHHHLTDVQPDPEQQQPPGQPPHIIVPHDAPWYLSGSWGQLSWLCPPADPHWQGGVRSWEVLGLVQALPCNSYRSVCYIISIVLILNTKYCTVPAVTRKINSILVKTTMLLY